MMELSSARSPVVSARTDVTRLLDTQSAGAPSPAPDHSL
jgi:hypothetical protein